MPDKGREPRSWRVPWGPVAWVVSLLALIALVPVADHMVGNFAGYVMILAVILVGTLRIDHWCSRQYWRGLKDYSSGG